jgi:ABC-2 type transport system ATP-binding protein
MIETRGLRKVYRTKKRRQVTTVDAVRGIDLSVAAGEIFGFLGPNGAGKTTTLRMLATLLAPDGGEATVAGADLLADPREVRRRIGYVAQSGSTWDEVSAREELALQARMYGASKPDALRAADAAMDSFGLASFGDRWCKTYSGGQRRKVDIALGVIHRPRVLFLDEPTTGLDPQSRANLWDEVNRLRDEGMTIFITTHYLEEADQLCDRVAIIDQGAIVAEGTPAELKKEVAGDVVSLVLNGSTMKAAEVLAGQPDVWVVEAQQTDSLRLRVESGSAAIQQIMRALDSSDIELGALELHRPSLDDVFLAKTGRSLRDA